MKKVVLAFDSFKGSATSVELAQAAKKGILGVMPQCEVLFCQIADGGEGTTASISAAMEGETIFCDVHDALMNPLVASYFITDDGTTAVLEMAASAGLKQIAHECRNPLITTTYGVGEMVRDALERGCTKVILGLGGSATNDAGMGMMKALGVRFLDDCGNELEPCGANFGKVFCIDTLSLMSQIDTAQFILATDVNIPFYGPKGAAKIFSPQKGANDSMVRMLESGLRHYASVMQKCMGVDISNLQSAGAAGGMAGGIFPFLNAEFKMGIDIVLELQRFKEALKDADLVLTGEGRFDGQTSMGKALHGILKISQSMNVPVIALCGGVDNFEKRYETDFMAVLSIQQTPISVEEAMKVEITQRNMEYAVSQLFGILKGFKK